MRGGKRIIQMLRQRAPQRAFPFVGKIKRQRLPGSVKRRKNSVGMAPDGGVNHIEPCEPAQILIAHRKARHHAFGVVAKNAVIVAKLHLGLRRDARSGMQV